MTSYPYTVRRSKRARSVRVAVHPERTVEVVLPFGVSSEAANDAVLELEPWIEKRMRALDKAQLELATTPGHLPLLGEEVPYCTEKDRKVASLTRGFFRLPKENCTESLERLYRRLARKALQERLDDFAAVVGVSYAGLSIRDQRTRWGSCSSTGKLSFNWRLLLAPVEVFEYVIWHELCHMHEQNHSERFWAHVSRVCPEYRAHARWLSRYGLALVLENFLNDPQ